MQLLQETTHRVRPKRINYQTKEVLMPMLLSLPYQLHVDRYLPIYQKIQNQQEFPTNH